jgi:MFS family permease
VIGAQVGITTLTSMIYPVAMRSTGLGWALGVGRVGSIVGPAIGGLMLATIADPRSVYLACTLPALIGALAIALLRWRASPPPLDRTGVRRLTDLHSPSHVPLTNPGSSRFEN